MSQPKAVFVRQPPSSPFKRPLLSSTPSGEPELPSPGDPMSNNQPRLRDGDPMSRGLNFTPLPAMAEVRSPDALHPQEGPCDCLSQGLQVNTIRMLSGQDVLGDLPTVCKLSAQIGFTRSTDRILSSRCISRCDITSRRSN